MTDEHELTALDIRRELYGRPLTWDEISQLPEDEQLAVALLFGTADLRERAKAVMVEQVKLELRTELPPNVVPIRPNIALAAIGHPVTPENAHNVELFAKQEIAQLTVERLRLHQRLASVEGQLNGANSKLAYVRQVKQDARTARRGAPQLSRVTMHEGVTHGDPDDAA